MDNVLSFLIRQPAPQVTQVGYLDVDGKTVTAITRRFAEADVPLCSLCPLCGSYDGVCTVMVDAFVPIEAAKLFDANATHFQPAEQLDDVDPQGFRRNMPWLDN